MSDIDRINDLLATAREMGLEVKTGKPVDNTFLDSMAAIMEIRFPDKLRDYFTTFGFIAVENLKVGGFTAAASGARDTFPAPTKSRNHPGEGYLPLYGESRNDPTIWICCRADDEDFGRIYHSDEDNFVASDFLSWLAEKLSLLIDSYTSDST